MHPVCKLKLRRTTVDGGRASLASSGFAEIGLNISSPAAGTPGSWSWLRFACSAPHSPFLEEGCRRCDCEGFASSLLQPRLTCPRPRTPPEVRPIAEIQTLSICLPVYRSPADLIVRFAQFQALRPCPIFRPTSHQPAACPQSLGCRRHGSPIHAEPSNNNKRLSRGQARIVKISALPG